MTGGSNGLAGVSRPTLFGIDLSAPDRMYVLVAATFLVVSLLIWSLMRSPYGRALTGVRENERRMRALGYDTTRLKLSAFVVAGMIAGVAGALSAYSQRFVSPGDAGIGTSVQAFVMVLIGYNITAFAAWPRLTIPQRIGLHALATLSPLIFYVLGRWLRLKRWNAEYQPLIERLTILLTMLEDQPS